MIRWSLANSSLPQGLDTSWNSVVLISSSSDGLLHPVSEKSVVDWISSDDALDNLVEPLVSSGGWSS